MAYSTMSSKVFHMENEYIKNIPWHCMEYFLRFSPTEVSRLTCSLASVIVTYPGLTYTLYIIISTSLANEVY